MQSTQLLQLLGGQSRPTECVCPVIPANALSIGVSKFESSRWHELRGNEDAERMHKRFLDLGFSSCVVCQDADKSTWSAALAKFEEDCWKSIDPSGAASAATIANALYIATHGYQLRNFKYPHCVPSDSFTHDDDFSLDECLSKFKWLETPLGCGRIAFIVIVDVCRDEVYGSNAIRAELCRKLRIRHSMALLLSCHEGQQSQELREGGGHLTDALLQSWTPSCPVLRAMLKAQSTSCRTCGFQCPVLEVVNMPFDLLLAPASCNLQAYPKKDATGILLNQVLDLYHLTFQWIWQGEPMVVVEGRQTAGLCRIMQAMGYDEFLVCGHDLRMLFRMQLCETFKDMSSTVSFLQTCQEQLQLHAQRYQHYEPLLVLCFAWLSEAHGIAAREHHKGHDPELSRRHMESSRSYFTQMLQIMDFAILDAKFITESVRAHRKLLNAALECETLDVVKLGSDGDIGSQRQRVQTDLCQLHEQLASLYLASEPEQATHELSHRCRLILNMAGASLSTAELIEAEGLMASIRENLGHASLRVKTRYFIERIRLATAKQCAWSEVADHELAVLRTSFVVLLVHCVLCQMRRPAKKLSWSWQNVEVRELLGRQCMEGLLQDETNPESYV